MPSIHDKNRSHSLLRPLAGWLGSIGIAAFPVRLLSTILVVAVAVTILIWPQYHWPLLLVPMVLFVRMLLNVTAGMLARESGNGRQLGTLFEELWDLVTEIILYLPFATVTGVSLMPIFIVICLGIISEVIRIVAIPIAYERHYDLPMRKGSMALVFGTLGLLLGLDVVSRYWLDILLWTVSGMLVVTMLNRVRGMVSPVHIVSE
jgi:CDP-diacylglycerol--glycerol-3-phosphate 3-phosphatidyltransferase